VPFLKVTLIYDGELPPSNSGKGKGPAKWAIRMQIEQQLQRAWREHPALARLRLSPIVPKNGRFMDITAHHSEPVDPLPFQWPIIRQPEAHEINLCEPLVRRGRKYFPLVRKSLALHCGLKILFLRNDEPGRVIQGGDLDNRLKTLFDALCVPTIDQAAGAPQGEDVIHCLLEDDALISKVEVQTEKLLLPLEGSKTQVRLVIEADIRVTQSRNYNSFFLGD
jgi:hypothetical protein